MMTVSYSVHDTSKGPGQKLNFDLDLDLNGEVTLKDMTQRLQLGLILIAKETLKEEQRQGFDKQPNVVVDKVRDRAVEKVSPFGQIEYYSRINDLEVLLQVYEAIDKRSPIKTGLYRDSNYVLFDNKTVATNYQEFHAYVQKTKKEGLGGVNEIRFINVTPYAARLEFRGTRRETRGLNKGINRSVRRTGKSRAKRTLGRAIKQPNGAYYLASRTLSNIKGFFATAKYEFIPNGYRGINIDAEGMMRKTYANNKKNQAKRRVGKPYVYPSIVFRINKLGIVK